MSEQTKPSVLSVVAMGMLAFLIIGSYDLARPAAESMFLKAYGSKSLPYVWLAVAAAAAGVVALYGRFAKDRSLLAVMAVVSLISPPSRRCSSWAFGPTSPARRSSCTSSRTCTLWC